MKKMKKIVLIVFILLVSIVTLSCSTTTRCSAYGGEKQHYMRNY